MLIDIQSMFKDIIETPQQRRAAMEQQGEQRAQTAVGTLSGAGGWAAPLVSELARQQPARSEALQRGLGGMLSGVGIERETRTPSQQLQTVLSEAGTDMQALPAKLREMGYGDKALEVEQAIAEKARQENIQAEEKALRDQQFTANNLAITKAKRLEKEATDVGTATTAFRTAAINSIKSSTVLSASEKEALTAQALAGGFDTNPKDLYNITSPIPIKVGDQVLIKGEEGQWSYVTDTTGSSKVASLLSTATLQYANNPSDMRVIEEAIQSGLIKDAKQFKDYAKTVKDVSGIQPSPDIEKYNIAGIEKANAASQNVNRIDTLLSAITSSGVLTNSPAGAWSDIVEGGKQFLGLRDTISFIRTALTSEKNLDLLSALPPGTASDRDILLFSEGYPPDNASIAEMAAWLEAAKSSLYRIQDFQTISGKILAEQLDKGQAPTTIGMDSRSVLILRDIDIIESVRRDLERDLSNGDISEEYAVEFFNMSLDAFNSEYQFIPAKYR